MNIKGKLIKALRSMNFDDSVERMLRNHARYIRQKNLRLVLTEVFWRFGYAVLWDRHWFKARNYTWGPGHLVAAPGYRLEFFPEVWLLTLCKGRIKRHYRLKFAFDDRVQSWYVEEVEKVRRVLRWTQLGP